MPMPAFDAEQQAARRNAIRSTKITLPQVFQSISVFSAADEPAHTENDENRLGRIEALSFSTKKKFLFLPSPCAACFLHGRESTALSRIPFSLNGIKKLNFPDELFHSGKISFASRIQIKQSTDFQIAFLVSALSSRQPILQQLGNSPRRSSALFHQFLKAVNCDKT